MCPQERFQVFPASFLFSNEPSTYREKSKLPQALPQNTVFPPPKQSLYLHQTKAPFTHNRGFICPKRSVCFYLA